MCFLFGCNQVSESNSQSKADAIAYAAYNLNFKYSDTLSEPEILLELKISNPSSHGLMIKGPLFKIVEQDTGMELQPEDLFAISDLKNIPTMNAYDDSIGDRLKHHLRFDLADYIFDSLKKQKKEIDVYTPNDIYAYAFIPPTSSKTFLVCLNVLSIKLMVGLRFILTLENQLITSPILM